MARIGNTKGNTALILVIFVLANALFFYLINAFTPLLNYKKQVIASNTKTNLVVSMENLKTTLKNTEALKAIVNLPENAAMKCLATNTCNSNMQLQPLKVVALDGTVMVDGDTMGIDRMGQVCSVLTDTGRCLFQVTIKWRPLCPTDGSPCMNANTEFVSELKRTTIELSSPLNLDKLEFTMRSSNLGALIE